MRRALSLVFLMGACNYVVLVAPGPGSGTGGDGTLPNVRLTPVDRVDVLVVMDSSPSMAGKQAAVASGVRALVAGLSKVNVHFGVVTADLGAGSYVGGGCHGGGDGAMLRGVGAAAPGSCAPLAGGADYLQIAPTGTSNAPGTVDAAIDCMMQVGTAGCAFGQPLEAARTVITGRSDFVRADAVLVVIFATDEDDCSAAPGTDLFNPASGDLGPLTTFRCARFGIAVGDPPMPLPVAVSGGPLPMPSPIAGTTHLYDLTRYVNLFARPLQTVATDAGTVSLGIKPDPADVLVLAIAGSPEPVEVIATGPAIEPDAVQAPCVGALDGVSCYPALRHACVGPDPRLYAGPAVRLRAVVAAAHRGDSASLCAADHRAEFDDLGVRIADQQGGHECLQTFLPDPQNPVCAVEQERLADGMTTAIPACAETARVPPCWTITADASCAPAIDPRTGAAERLRLRVTWGAAEKPATDYVTRVRCVGL